MREDFKAAWEHCKGERELKTYYVKYNQIFF